MEERIKFLEDRVNTLALAYMTQKETIDRLINCVNTIDDILKREAEFDKNLFTYCKKLRREIDELRQKGVPA